MAELRFGIVVLPLGAKKRRLQEEFDESILSLFTGRILPFHEDSALAYAKVRADAKAKGRAIGVADGFIAAIASQHGFSVATRDTSPFEAAGLSVINPWQL